MAHAAQRLVRVPILYHEAHHAAGPDSGPNSSSNPQPHPVYPPLSYYQQFGVPPHSISTSLGSSTSSPILTSARSSQPQQLV
jgi:hypothetical protein